SGWLQVTPSSVQLGCGGNQQTQVVTLANTGPEDVQWQAEVQRQAGMSGSGDRPGVTLSPNQGELGVGERVSIEPLNTTSSARSQGGSSRQGIIRFRFTTDTTDTGPPASLSWTSARCP